MKRYTLFRGCTGALPGGGWALRGHLAPQEKFPFSKEQTKIEGLKEENKAGVERGGGQVRGGRGFNSELLKQSGEQK